jgi:glutathione S-transferase
VLRILGRAASINVGNVLWTCAEVDLAYERAGWGAGFRPTDTAAFRSLNPNELVPIIEDADRVLWGSNSILRYLASCLGGEHLYQSDPRQRARID